MKLSDLTQRARAALKYRMLIEQGRLCAYCDRKMSYDPRDRIRFATFDHIVSLAEGGSDNLENLTLACEPCNKAKSCLSLDDLKQMVERIELLTEATTGKPNES